MNLEQQLACAARPALVAVTVAAVEHLIAHSSDEELRGAILQAIDAKDFPREVAAAVLDAASRPS